MAFHNLVNFYLQGKDIKAWESIEYKGRHYYEVTVHMLRAAWPPASCKLLSNCAPQPFYCDYIWLSTASISPHKKMFNELPVLVYMDLMHTDLSSLLGGVFV